MPALSLTEKLEMAVTEKSFVEVARIIVDTANSLKRKHAPQYAGHVSYCCYFSQSEESFEKLNKSVAAVGRLAKDTKTGPVYVVPRIDTVAGPLRVFKVRKVDPSRKELGDADFALQDYESFKRENIGRPGFKLIEREEFEMIELVDPEFNARAYFSNPPIEEHQGIKQALMEGGSN